MSFRFVVETRESLFNVAGRIVDGQAVIDSILESGDNAPIDEAEAQRRGLNLFFVRNYALTLGRLGKR